MLRRLLFALVVTTVATPCWATLVFTNQFGSGMLAAPDAQAAFLRAEAAWAAVLNDNVEVVIQSDFSSLGPNIIGSSSSSLLQAGYTTIRNAMANDMIGTADQALGQALPNFSEFTATTPANLSLSGQMYLTSANAKALGFNIGMFNLPYDASINFSSAFPFDFDNSNGVTPGTVDFQTVVLHEIGHALGFISAVDDLDTAAMSSVTFTTLDMYRFGPTNPTSLAMFTTTPRYFVPGGTSFFGDTVHQWALSTGVNQGDGRQASHWKDDVLNSGTLIGVMDPTLANGVTYGISAADIQAMNLIGWNITAVPEPGTLALISTAIVFCLRRRAKRS